MGQVGKKVNVRNERFRDRKEGEMNTAMTGRSYDDLNKTLEQIYNSIEQDDEKIRGLFKIFQRVHACINVVFLCG